MENDVTPEGLQALIAHYAAEGVRVEFMASAKALGCICPPGSEKTCQGPLCPRRPVQPACDQSKWAGGGTAWTDPHGIHPDHPIIATDSKD